MEAESVMNELWRGRMAAIVALLIAGGALTYISMGSLGDNLVYYWSPTEVNASKDEAMGATIRLGGQVVPGTVDWKPDSQALKFRITDGQTEQLVTSTGAPPQMFREGIGVVVEGRLQGDGTFETDRVMIKHSNEYRAPEDGESPDEVYKTLDMED
jgi:cytochrome c-type biogenesis protein CcmE